MTFKNKELRARIAARKRRIFFKRFIEPVFEGLVLVGSLYVLMLLVYILG